MDRKIAFFLGAVVGTGCSEIVRGCRGLPDPHLQRQNCDGLSGLQVIVGSCRQLPESPQSQCQRIVVGSVIVVAISAWCQTMEGTKWSPLQRKNTKGSPQFPTRVPVSSHLLATACGLPGLSASPFLVFSRVSILRTTVSKWWRSLGADFDRRAKPAAFRFLRFSHLWRA